MQTQTMFTPNLLTGSGTRYRDIGVREDGAVLSVGLDYGLHQSGIGCVIARFIARGNLKTPLKHFAVRTEGVPYHWRDEKGYTIEMVKGIRLNKVVIEVFEAPAPNPQTAVIHLHDKNVDDHITKWLVTEMEKDNFEVGGSTDVLLSTVRELLSMNTGTSVLALKWPDLAKDKAIIDGHNQAMASVNKYDDDDLDDDDDPDDDETVN